MPLDMFPAPADETFAAGLTLGIDELDLRRPVRGRVDRCAVGPGVIRVTREGGAAASRVPIAKQTLQANLSADGPGRRPARSRQRAWAASIHGRMRVCRRGSRREARSGLGRRRAPGQEPECRPARDDEGDCRATVGAPTHGRHRPTDSRRVPGSRPRLLTKGVSRGRDGFRRSPPSLLQFADLHFARKPVIFPWKRLYPMAP